MYKILLVDDKINNNIVLEQLLKSYIEQHEMDGSNIEITVLDNGIDAIKKVVESRDIDLIFLDLMMPKIQGMDVLEVVRLMDLPKQPKIVIVTALHDKSTRMEARRKKANAYITKPVDSKMVKAMLDFYMNKSIQISQDEEFFDLDDDDAFFDLDDDFEMSESQKDSLTEFNNTHLKVSAKEFLEDIENLEFIIEDFSEIEMDLLRTMDNLSSESLESNIKIIIEGVKLYSSLLNGFVDFYELSMALRALQQVLQEADFGDNMLMSHKERIAMFIKAMLNDLVDWHNHVFILQDSIDVFYLNASVLSSCIQLENMIKNAYDIN